MTSGGANVIKKLLTFGAVVGAMVWLGASVPGCRRKVNEYAPPPPPEVTVAHPVRRVVTRYLEYTGTTEASESAELRARVVGFLEDAAMDHAPVVSGPSA